MARQRRTNNRNRNARNTADRNPKSNNVVKFRPRFNLNLGLIIFGVLFVYIIVVIV